jgi:hypothetical protein
VALVLNLATSTGRLHGEIPVGTRNVARELFHDKNRGSG